MKTININVSKSYNVEIGSGILKNIGDYAKKVLKSPSKIAVVTDDIVDKLYSASVCNNLKENGFEVIKFVMEHGEKSKNSVTYINLLNFLAENHMTRTDALLALGGGVVGDLTGFAAATYLRGIRFFQCPTTLLAMVDSSVGGKTAIDLECGKNLVGAFYQPEIVVCDYNTLKTLPDEVFTDGCSEVIKYGAILDKELFDHLKEHIKAFDTEYVIAKCVDLKRMTVTEDEFDHGIRQLLNFGHTLGHSVEALSEYNVSHGKAVAIGMCLISKASAEKNLCDMSCYEEIKKLIADFNLPTETSYSKKELFNVTENDKKRKGNSITIVVPEKIGKCVLKKMEISDFYEFIELGI